MSMKHWQETREIARRLAAAPGAARAVATVVRIEGSAYRRPGAKLLVTDGGMVGGVSGGCLEADVREVGLDALRSNRACTRRYDTGADGDSVWGLGLGCEGRVEVLVQPLTESLGEFWRTVAALLDGSAPFALATPLDGETAGQTVVLTADRQMGGSADRSTAIAVAAHARLATGETGIDAVDGIRVFTEVLTPPPGLLVLGAGNDAIPLVALATSQGFRVTVVDHRPAFVTAERFPGAYARVVRRAAEGAAGLPTAGTDAAVVMTHAFEHDREWLRVLARTALPYLGVLGPRTRTARLMDDLGLEGDGRLYGPVGLDLAADGPEQIAVSVVAEILAARAERAPTHLRDRSAAIHA